MTSAAPFGQITLKRHGERPPAPGSAFSRAVPQSLAGWFVACWGLFLVGAAVAGIALVSLYREGTADRLPRAEVAVARGCDAVRERYRFANARLDWTAPETTQALPAATLLALRDLPGVEGGLWRRVTGALAYARAAAALGALTAVLLGSAAWLGWLLFGWSRRQRRIEAALAGTQAAELPRLEPTGQRDLDRIVHARNIAAARVAEARAAATQATAGATEAERLAGLGRVAAGVAQEVRNPIAAMRLKAENALANEDPARMARALHVVLDQVARLDTLSRDLLGAARGGAPLARAPVEPDALVAGRVAFYQEQAAAAGVALRAERNAPGPARMDAARLERAPDNLILNALKATPRGGGVEVSAARRGGSCWRWPIPAGACPRRCGRSCSSPSRPAMSTAPASASPWCARPRRRTAARFTRCAAQMAPPSRSRSLRSSPPHGPHPDRRRRCGRPRGPGRGHRRSRPCRGRGSGWRGGAGRRCAAGARCRAARPPDARSAGRDGGAAAAPRPAGAAADGHPHRLCLRRKHDRGDAASAFDHLIKLVGRADIAELLGRMLRPAATAGPVGPAPEAAGALVGVSPGMRAVQKTIGLVADSDATVLVTGETGTGKEVVARVLHRHGRRAAGPFVAVNCAALPSELLKSELFGHVRGAFTAAVAERRGAFRDAAGGTLFLDEIGDMGLATQAKILRVVQERKVSPLGGRPVRIVAATHRDLPARVRDGAFREDLYYRLAVVTIHLPPLRDRPADLVPLAEHFLAQLGGGRRLGQDAAARLLAHAWPGNARELRNAIERAAALGRTPVIGAAELGLAGAAAPQEAGSGGDLPGAVARLERAMIGRALQDCGGNRAEAVRRLGIHRQLLYAKLRQFGRNTASDAATPDVRNADAEGPGPRR